MKRFIALAFLAIAAACHREEPLTKEKADEILKGYQFQREPVYAAVPQRVWWDPQHPKDDFDEKSERTLRNLQANGYITLTEVHEGERTIFTAKVAEKGFKLLGTGPSARGPVFKALICYKKYEGVRDFQRHPNEPTTGRAELVWRYADATPLYELFETKGDKPLDKPFASLVSFYYKDYQWKFNVTVRKTDVTSGEVPTAKQ